MWGGSGVGAELRSELQFVECLKDFGPGGQNLRNVEGLSPLGGPDFAELRGWVGPLKKNPHACGVGVGWERS